MLIPFAIHCLTKDTAFVPQCEIMEPYTGKQLLLSHIAWLAALAMQCDTPKAYASHRFSSWRFQNSFLQERYYDIWSQAYLRTHTFWNRSLRSLYARFARYPKCVTHLWCVSVMANPIPLLVSLQLRFARSNFVCAAGFACAQAASIYWNPVSAFHRLVFAHFTIN